MNQAPGNQLSPSDIMFNMIQILVPIFMILIAIGPIRKFLARYRDLRIRSITAKSLFHP